MSSIVVPADELIYENGATAGTGHKFYSAASHNANKDNNCHDGR